MHPTAGSAVFFLQPAYIIRQNPTVLDSAHKQHHLLSEHTQKSSVYAVRHIEGRRQPILMRPSL